MNTRSDAKPYVVPFGKSTTGETNLIINQNYNIHHPSIGDANLNYYPDRTGIFLRLINEIAGYVGCTPDEVLLTHGSENALKLIMETYCRSGTNVLIPFPNYPGFIHKAELYQANITYVRCHGELAKVYEEIENCDIIYLSSPNLPIGYEVPHSIYEYIAKYPNKLFIIDEAYFEYGTISHYNKAYTNLIIVRTFSKAFALAGARVGYIIADKKIIQELKVAHCDKDILDYSVEICYKAMLHKDYYLAQVQHDKNIWADFFVHLKRFVRPADLIYEFMVGHGPYFLIFTEHTDYVCQMFKKNGYLVRDKSADLGRGCIRISLNIEKIMIDLLRIIKKINGYYREYQTIYLDIDKTIRESGSSAPVDGVVTAINELSKNKKIHFVTNNISGRGAIEEYLRDFNYVELICPFGDVIADEEYKNGYFIREKNLYLTKFPNITYELMRFIAEHGVIHIVEEDYTESSRELGISGPDINLPFIGAFKKLLGDMGIEPQYRVIGKKNLYVTSDTDTIVIGDSDDDFLFAKNNGFYFKRIHDCRVDTVAALRNML